MKYAGDVWGALGDQIQAREQKVDTEGVSFKEKHGGMYHRPTVAWVTWQGPVNTWCSDEIHKRKEEDPFRVWKYKPTAGRAVVTEAFSVLALLSLQSDVENSITAMGVTCIIIGKEQGAKEPIREAPNPFSGESENNS